ILWLGERDARTVMTAFDVFVISSCKEGLPYVVLEAMSAGLPVVATDTAGVESLVERGVNGVVVPCGDCEAFADALVDLVLDPAKILRMGRVSAERASQFTTEAMVTRTLSLYLGVPETRPAFERPQSPRAPAGATASAAVWPEDRAPQFTPAGVP